MKNKTGGIWGESEEGAGRLRRGLMWQVVSRKEGLEWYERRDAYRVCRSTKATRLTSRALKFPMVDFLVFRVVDGSV